MSLAERIRTLRTQAGMSLEDLASKAHVSKTYLWELEKDEEGVKKPSADVLLRLANALSTTIAELLALPTVRAQTEQVQLPPPLVEFSRLMEAQGTTLTEQDLRDLAMMRFRGGQPRTAQEWMQVYLVFAQNQTGRRKKS
jgi:transcriptional regulator with XRE-family HTH domain